MWADATANFGRLCNPEGVRALVENCRRANINILVVDVKDLTGRVLYDSSIAPRLQSHAGYTNVPGFDLLRTASEECRKQGIAIYASINVFSEGRKKEGGPVFQHPDWESVAQTSDAWVRAEDDVPYPVASIGRRAYDGRLALFLDPEKAGAREEEETWLFVDRDTETALGSEAGPSTNAVLLAAKGAAGSWLGKIRAGDSVRVFSRPKFIASRFALEMHNAVFVNPVNPDVRAYELSIIREIAANYDIDGIIFDRMRYSGLNADFSDLSRRSFEAWLGREVDVWPEDVLTFPALENDEPRQGPLFAKWIEWRASNITEFFAEAGDVVRKTRPGMEAAVYVGSWYWSYYPMGVNWASDTYRPEADWASSDFHRTGYAKLADWITTGCYYPHATRDDAIQAGGSGGASVQAAAEGSAMVIGNASFTYAGLYLVDYQGKPEQLVRAIDMCRTATQGVMLFDLVYVEDYDWWNVLRRAFPEPAPIPHKLPELREQLQQAYLKDR